MAGMKKRVAVIDSGTSLLLFPRQDYNALMQFICQHVTQRECDYTSAKEFSCSACTHSDFPTLMLQFDATRTLSLQGSDYVR
jgi:hypothetical protein